MKKILPIFAGVVIVIGLLLLVTRVTAKNNAQNNVLAAASASPTPAIKLHTPIGYSLNINIPGIKNSKKLNYTIDSADLANEIIVSGQKIQSTTGKRFLILNLKISNDNTQGVQINSRDYVRLAAPDNNNEWWAPEIYNDPVEVQAISTKLSRIGFTVNSNDKSFKLKAGEINGEKKDFEIKF